MRANDIDRLSASFPDGIDVDSKAASALGVALPDLQRLEQAILNDLQEAPPYGISWWAAYMTTAHRILISDQLYACTQSVSVNLSEACLHWLEFLDWVDRENDRIANSVRIDNGQLHLDPPQHENALQVITPQMKELHVIGVTRALASALDCLAGALVAIAALPTSILKADFNVVHRKLTKAREKNSSDRTEGEQLQACLSERLEELIDQCGPHGWVQWMLQYRNMLVHRGRRIQIGQYVPSRVLGPDGHPARTYTITHLPCDPGRSDVEVLRDPAGLSAALLTEDAETTLKGLITSTSTLIDAVANELWDIWAWRRQHTAAVVQPVSQWRVPPSADSVGFSGYAPGTFEVSFSMGGTHPTLAKRLRAAALDDEARPQLPR